MASKPSLSGHAGSAPERARVMTMSIVLCSLTAGYIFGDSPGSTANAERAKATLLAVPLSFEINQGQTDRAVMFLSRANGYALFLTRDSAVFKFGPAGKNSPPTAVRMKLAGANS